MAMKARGIGFVIGFLGISLFALLLTPVILDFGSMDWFDEGKRAEALLACIALGIAAIGTWLGRGRLLSTVPCVLIFLLLAAIGIPGAIPARSEAQRAACKYNLRVIANAKSEWAKEKGKTATDVPTEDDLYGTNKFPRCPRGGIYRIGAVSEEPACTFANKGHKLSVPP